MRQETLDKILEFTMYEKLEFTKEELEFLLDTNDECNPINEELKHVIQFIQDELDYAMGL